MVEAVRVGSADGGLVVEIVCSEPVSYLVVDTPEPFTITLFLAHAAFAFPAATRELSDGPLRRVAGVVLDRPDGLLARLDLVFERPAGYRVHAEGRRLVVHLDAPGVPDAVVLGTAVPEPLEARVGRLPEPVAPPAAPAPAPAPATPARPTPTAPAPAATAARLVRITPSETGDGVRVSLEADRPLVPRTFTLEGPPRLVLDFDNVLATLGRFTVAVGGRVLERIRAGQFRTVPVPVARVVLDLRRLVPYRVEPHARGAVIHLRDRP